MADIKRTVITEVVIDNKQYVAGLKTQEKQQDETNQATEEGTEAVEEMSGALDGVLSQFGVMPGALGKARTGLGTLTKGFGTLRTAIIATGIGALLIALVSLQAMFTRTAEGQERMAIITATLGELFNQITEIAISLGEALFNAFNDPKQAVKDLWDFIKTNFVNRIEALVKFLPAVGRAIKAAFTPGVSVTDALKEVGTLVVQMGTGLDEIQQKNVLQGMSDRTKEIADNIRAATQIQREANALRRENIAFITREAELTRDIAAARLRANDETLALAQQLEGINEAEQLTNALFEERGGFLERELDQLERKQALGSNTLEDDEQAQRLRADIIRLNEQRDNQLRSLLRRQTTLNNASAKLNEIKEEGLELDDAAIKKLEERTIKAEEELLKIEENEDVRLAKQIENVEEQEQKLLELAEQRNARILLNDQLLAEERLVIERNYEIEVLRIREDAAKSRAALEQTSLKNTEDNKDLEATAIKGAVSDIGEHNKNVAGASAFIDLFAGIQKTIANVGYPLAIPLVALQTALGLKQIADIQGQNIPRAARGYMIGGNKHSRGGTLIEAERGEAVVTAATMSDPFLGSLVSWANMQGGGIPLAQRGFLAGKTQQANSLVDLTNDVDRSLRNNRAVLVTEVLESVQARVDVTENIATL